MAVSWVCTDEKAIESLRTDFGLGETAYKTLGSDLEDVSGSWTTARGSSFASFEGRFSLGLSLLAEIIGARALEMSGHAGDVESAYLVCETELDALTTTSDALLTESEELVADWESAVQSYADHDGYATTRRNKRNEFEHGTAERANWHQAYVDMKGYRDAFGATRDAKAGALDTNQIEFVRLREDEEAAHQTFADTLGGLDVAKSAVEVDVSAAEASSVELLITYLDAQFLALGTGSGSGRSRAALRAAIRSARETIAGLAGVDTEPLDRLVEIVEAKRELAALGSEGYEDALRQAQQDGDLDEARRLMKLLADGMSGMSPEDAQAFRDVIENLADDMDTFGRGFRHFFLFFATFDEPVPDWVIDIILSSEGSLAYFGLDDIEMRDELARLLGLPPNDSELGDKILMALYRKVAVEQGGGFIDQLLGSGTDNPIARDIAYEWIMRNPSHLDQAIEAGGNTLQEYLDLFAAGSTDAQMDALFAEVLGRLVDISGVVPDAALGEISIDMKQFGDEIGTLLYQFGRAGENSTWDMTPIITWLGKKGLGLVPYGSQALIVIDGLETLMGSYQESTLYDDILADEGRAADESIVAMGAIIAAGGPNSEAVASLVNSEGGIVEAYAAIKDGRFGEHKEVAQYVDEFRQEIVVGVEEAERGDD